MRHSIGVNRLQFSEGIKYRSLSVMASDEHAPTDRYNMVPDIYARSCPRETGSIRARRVSSRIERMVVDVHQSLFIVQLSKRVLKIV